MSRNSATPIQTRYAPPTHFSSVNAVADAASSADNPSAAAKMCTKQPAPMPSAAIAPPRQPWLVERLTMYSVSGPGEMFSNSPDTTNNARSCTPNIFQSSSRNRAGT